MRHPTIGRLLLTLAVALPGCASDDAPAATPLDSAIAGAVDGAVDVEGDVEGDGAGRTDGGDSCQRRVLAADVTNARELGGHPLAGGARVACGKLLRGGQLDRLTEAGCAELRGLGVRSVLDLREQATQAASPPPSCVTEQAEHVSVAMPKLLPPTPEAYLALLDESTAIAALFASLGRPERYPAYIHCVIGRDRASVATALVLLALGAERQSVIDEFMLSADGGVQVQAAWITAVVDEIDARGGIDSFLGACGVTPAQLEVLRAEGRGQP